MVSMNGIVMEYMDDQILTVQYKKIGVETDCLITILWHLLMVRHLNNVIYE